MLTSLPVWACMAGYFCQWQMVSMTSGFAPSYFKEVLGVAVVDNGIFSALPLFFFLLGRWASGFASDLRIGSPTFRVKLSNSLFAFGSGSCVFLLSFLREGSPPALAVALLCGQLWFCGFATGGYQKAVVLIAPQFAATIGSVTNVLGSSGSTALPFIVIALTPTGTAAEWARVLYYLTATAVFAGLVFLFLGSAEIQTWAKPLPSKLSQIPLTATPTSRTLLSEEGPAA